LVAVALKIVSAELIDDDDHDEFRVGVVGRGLQSWGSGKEQGDDEGETERSVREFHGEGSLHRLQLARKPSRSCSN